MKNNQITQFAALLTYAIARDGRLVNVDSVKTGKECGCTCPCCNESLIAKNNGSLRKHHFAHQSGTDCEGAYETMLHLLAKERVQKAFLEAESFWMEYKFRLYCPTEDLCKFKPTKRCRSSKRKRFDLKQYYDCCEQEIVYDNIRRRSDLKIYSSTNPSRKPIYIEFCVTHASENEKLHSGAKIIECVIENERDIDKIVKNGFINHKHNKTIFYGFKNEEKAEEQLDCEIDFVRYSIYKSGKSLCRHEYNSCQNLKNKNQYSLYDVCFNTSIINEVIDYAKYLGYNRYHIPNCMFCRNYVESYDHMGRICRLYKRLQMSRYDFDRSKAKDCRYYSFNQEEYDRTMQTGCPIPYEEII